MSNYMSKRNVFTTITPLPASLTRKTVIDFFHNHMAMIDLNPLVIERHTIKPPENASADESSCVWYSLTDKVHYLPGGMASGNVSYTACFNDLPNGVQTHCRAPAGVDIRSLWSLRGSLPGEPKEPMELGLTVPKEGLYIREDVDLRCNFILSSFVRKTLKKAHSVLVDRLLTLAERKEMDKALSEQFPMGNKAATPSQAQTQPGPGASTASVASGVSGVSGTPGAPGAPGAPGDSMGMPTHPAYMAHPHNSHQYPYEPHSPVGPSGQYPPSISSSDPRMSDPRMSMYSSPDPRASYQSGWSGYGPQGQYAPPGYQQPYGYGYPPVPGNVPMHPQMGYGPAPAWNPQTGWYQPTNQPVEIASSEMMMLTDEKKKVEDKDDKKDKKEKEENKKEEAALDKKRKDEARSDKLLEAYPQPVRANTYEMM